MSENTKIEWCHHSWSPWRGCTKVSPGCAHCYAETLSKRNPAVLGQWGKGAPRVLAKNWGDPMRWNRKQAERCCSGCDFDEAEGELILQCDFCSVRPRVFPSLCDWLDEEVPVEWLVRFLKLIHDTPNLDWLLLSKRPDNWGKRVTAALAHVEGILEPDGWEGDASTPIGCWLNEWLAGTPPPNVWFGVSVEDQPRAHDRIPLLLDIPARLRWLSVEPLLGPVDLSIDGLWKHTCERSALDFIKHADDGKSHPDICRDKADQWMDARKTAKNLDWVVVGGESGPGARPCNVEWIRSIVRECQSADVPVFVKQLGANPHCECGELPANGQTGWHPKGGDPAEWPQDLRFRQYPEGA